MVFGTTKTSKYKFYINNQLLETVKEYKYLGVFFSSSGSFLNCRKYLVEIANKALFHVFTKINNLNLPIDLKIKLFDQTIVSILTYGCEVWGYENLDIIENVHCSFLRRITKVKKSTLICRTWKIPAGYNYKNKNDKVLEQDNNKQTH